MDTEPRDFRGHAVAADLIWTGRDFEEGRVVEIEPSGRILDVVPEVDTSLPVQRLTDRAILPGFVNTHSHAFQRGLRGRGETYPRSAGSFWTWRETMYRLVGEIDRDGLFELSRQAFSEMRAAGITSVGEFHYLHHDDSEAESGEGDFAFDRVVLEAAQEAGIRIALLSTYYETGGVGQELRETQHRFRTKSPEIYWRQVHALRHEIERNEAEDLQTVGAAVHSLRAAPPERLRKIHEEAVRRGLPLHLHLEEQRREIEEVREAYGRSPMEILQDELMLSPAVTAVHCTHTEPDALRSFVTTGASVCVCPLTEANLGDGLPHLPEACAFRICLGTDSNARISMLEEMRWLEYGQRLRGESRGMLRDEDGRVAPVLLEAATVNGARALRLETGSLDPGLWADLALVDLTHPSLSGSDEETLLEALIFGADDGAIAGTCVGGRAG